MLGSEFFIYEEDYPVQGIDSYFHQFENITLTRPIGRHPKGSKFPVAVIDYKNSQLELYHDFDNSIVEIYKLKSDVGRRLS